MVLLVMRGGNGVVSYAGEEMVLFMRGREWCCYLCGGGNGVVIYAGERMVLLVMRGREWCC